MENNIENVFKKILNKGRDSSAKLKLWKLEKYFSMVYVKKTKIIYIYYAVFSLKYATNDKM